MPGPIICGIADDEAARLVLRAADELHRRLDLELLIVHAASQASPAARGGVLDARRLDPWRQERSRAGASVGMGAIAASERVGDVRVLCEVRPPASWLVGLAERERAELLVIGSRRRGPAHQLVLGSVSAAIISAAPCPVLIVPKGDAGRWRDGQIVCAVDDSDASVSAVLVAGELAARLARRLVLVNVQGPPQLPGVGAVPGGAAELVRAEVTQGMRVVGKLAALTDPGVTPVTRVAMGTPGGAVADVADEEGASLVVVGTRAHGAFRAAVLGSVSRDIVRSSPCPVLVVPRDYRANGLAPLAEEPQMGSALYGAAAARPPG